MSKTTQPASVNAAPAPIQNLQPVGTPPGGGSWTWDPAQPPAGAWVPLPPKRPTQPVAPINETQE